MRKALSTVALTAIALTGAMATSGAAYADTAAPEISVADLSVLAIPSGCTLTYAGMVAGEPTGRLVYTGPGTVTVGYGAATVYVLAQGGNTVWYVGCI